MSKTESSSGSNRSISWKTEIRRMNENENEKTKKITKLEMMTEMDDLIMIMT